MDESDGQRETAELAEIAALTPQVEKLFRAATKQFDPPAQTTCRAVAALLVAARLIAEHDNQTSVQLYEAERQKAENAARRYLAAIKPIRERLAKIAPAAEKHPEMDWAEKLAERDRIEAAARAVEAALPIPSRKSAGRLDLIRSIAAMAQIGWRRANNRKAPCGFKGAAKGKEKESGPLVKFVTAALAESGVHISAHEVSDILRGRRRTKGGAKTGQ